MPRSIMFPESDTEPEKYSRRSRQVRVFFADENDTKNRSMKIRRNRGPRKNYMEDSEDKPIQQNVRRSCRKRKLLHHNFNESWITNEFKVKGYPDLYGFPSTSSSDEFSSGDEARETKKITRSHVPTNTDEDTQLSRRRTSARFTKLKDASDSDSDDDNNQTVIEKKPTETKQVKEENDKMDTEETPAKKEQKDDNNEKDEDQDSTSNQVPARSTRRRGKRIKKKVDSHQETVSSSSSSESSSELTLRTRPRRSARARTAQPAFVQLTPRETRPRGKTFTLRKKPYSLRERKPKLLRRKTIRSQSPSNSSSSSSTTSSDTEEDLNVSMKNKTKGRQKSKSMDDKKTDRALRDIQPIVVDGSVRFSSVGGLEEHIKCLREMVLFPLMYPDLFDKFKTRPAKGVLFHGPPGTGKTLLARALANECSLVGGRKVAFFMRKGADCLKKWVGESERHLKLLFQQANKMKPSIIFFDEIDALAPVRSVRQEQVHTSVVGTLLAEMDGVCDRGEVIVIGATNRLDAVDPALRRAGRFDRELHFPPPHAAARRDILNIYTKHWVPKPSEDTLDHIADVTNGYGGSDLKALCSEAVLKALKRVYPQVYESEYALVIDPKNVEVTQKDLEAAMRGLVAAGARSAPPSARRLPQYCAPLLAAQVKAAAELLTEPTLSTVGSLSTPSSSNVLLIMGPCAETHLAPALLARLEKCTVRELSVAALHSALAYTQEQALISLFSECRRADRGCILFIRDVIDVWRALSAGSGASLLLQLWRSRAAGEATLMLATAPADVELPVQLQELFPEYKDCVYRVREPTAPEVINFLKPIITEAPLEPPVLENSEPPPPLPRAPPPPPPRESKEEVARRKRKEDYKLRELRIFLRDICRKLASNRRFYKFTKPVDLEETVSEQRAPAQAEMQARHSFLWHLLIDLPILLLVAAVCILLEVGALPSRRSGFRCNDPDLSFPHTGDTISISLVAAITVVVPYLIIWAIETVLHRDDEYSIKQNKLYTSARSAAFIYRDYIYGAVVNLTVLEVVKCVVGSPRPTFFDLCEPDKARTCNGSEYISSYTCTSSKYSRYLQIDSSRSFPSAHTSLSVYCGLFLAWYLQRRAFSWHNRSVLMIPLVQILCVVYAVTCPLTRITDHRHHWWDVLAGAVMGVASVVYTILVLCKNFSQPAVVSTSDISSSDSNNHQSVRRLLSSQPRAVVP